MTWVMSLLPKDFYIIKFNVLIKFFSLCLKAHVARTFFSTRPVLGLNVVPRFKVRRPIFHNFVFYISTMWKFLHKWFHNYSFMLQYGSYRFGFIWGLLRVCFLKILVYLGFTFGLLGNCFLGQLCALKCEADPSFVLPSYCL